MEFGDTESLLKTLGIGGSVLGFVIMIGFQLFKTFLSNQRSQRDTDTQAQSFVQSLMDENKELRERNNELHKRCSELVKDRDDAVRSLSDLKVEIGSLRNEVQSLRNELAQYKGVKSESNS